MTVRTSRLLLDDRHRVSSRRFQTTMTQDAYGTKVPDRVISVEMAEQSTAAFTGGTMTSGARARDEAVRSGGRIAEAENRKQRGFSGAIPTRVWGASPLLDWLDFSIVGPLLKRAGAKGKGESAQQRADA